jgi:hypothetical protein
VKPDVAIQTNYAFDAFAGYRENTRCLGAIYLTDVVANSSSRDGADDLANILNFTI